MAYTKTVWKDTLWDEDGNIVEEGTPINAARLNNMEEGIEGAETPEGAQEKANAALSESKTYTDQKVADLVDTAPGTLDTLNELASALGDDPNFATTITNQIASKETPEGAQTKANTAEANAIAAVTIHAADYTKHPGTGVASGTNAKTITLNPAPTSYSDWLEVVFKNNTQNTGAVTLNVNSLGAIPVKKSSGSDLASGNLKAGSIYTVRYNATTGNFILQGEGGEYGNATAADVLQGVTFGTENGVLTGALIPGKKFASGSLSGASGSISNLTFQPEIVIVYQSYASNYRFMEYDAYRSTNPVQAELMSKYARTALKDGTSATVSIVGGITVSANGFTYDFGSAGGTGTTYYKAIE